MWPRPLAVEPQPRPTATKLRRAVAVGATAGTAIRPGWLFSQPSTATRHSRVAVGRGRGCGGLWVALGWLWVAVAALMGCPSVSRPRSCSRPRGRAPPQPPMAVGRPVCPRGGTLRSQSVPAPLLDPSKASLLLQAAVPTAVPPCYSLPASLSGEGDTPRALIVGSRAREAGTAALCRIIGHDSWPMGPAAFPATFPATFPETFLAAFLATLRAALRRRDGLLRPPPATIPSGHAASRFTGLLAGPPLPSTGDSRLATGDWRLATGDCLSPTCPPRAQGRSRDPTAGRDDDRGRSVVRRDHGRRAVQGKMRGVGRGWRSRVAR